jgi:hypothetical protein
LVVKSLSYAAGVILVIGAAAIASQHLHRNARASKIVTIGSTVIEQGLVGHWKLDETSGTIAIDSSGNGHHGNVIGDLERTNTGKIGGAILCNGRGGHIEVPDTPILQNIQGGDYSLAAWFRPNGIPSVPTSDSSLKDHHAIIAKPGGHIGLTYCGDLGFYMHHWMGRNEGVAARSSHPFAPEALYHVAGVVKPATGSIAVYVNGRLEAINTWMAEIETQPYGNATWRIGIADPGASDFVWSADGIIDDVRMYNRALTSEEIAALAASPSTIPGGRNP